MTCACIPALIAAIQRKTREADVVVNRLFLAGRRQDTNNIVNKAQ